MCFCFSLCVRVQSVCSRLCLRRVQLWGQSWMRREESTRVSWESSPDWSRDTTTSGRWVCSLRFRTHPQTHSNTLTKIQILVRNSILVSPHNSAPRATEGRTLPRVWTWSLCHPRCCHPSLSPHSPFHRSHLPSLPLRRSAGSAWHLPPSRGGSRCGGLKHQWWEKEKLKEEWPHDLILWVVFSPIDCWWLCLWIQDQLMESMDVAKDPAVKMKGEDLAHAYDAVRVANKSVCFLIHSY